MSDYRTCLGQTGGNLAQWQLKSRVHSAGKLRLCCHKHRNPLAHLLRVMSRLSCPPKSTYVCEVHSFMSFTSIYRHVQPHNFFAVVAYFLSLRST